MSPRNKLLAGVGAAIVVGVLLILAVRGFGGKQGADLPVASSPVAAAPVEPDAPGNAPAADILPWEQGQPVQSGTTLSARPDMAQAVDAASMQAMAEETQKTLVQMRQQSRQNITATDALLRELDELEKSGKVPPDIKIGALRNNLNVARRAQVLAMELAESTQKPSTPESKQRNAEIVAELQALQGKIDYDVGSGVPQAMQPGATQ